MKITVKFFALGKDLIGQDELEMELSESGVVADLIAQLEEKFPPFKELGSYLIAVNLEYAEHTDALKDGDEVAIIPPVSGG